MNLDTQATVHLIKSKTQDSKAESKTSGRLQGEPVTLYEPEPWHEPVDGAVVLTDIAEVIMRHMAIREVDAYTVALWCAHAHIFEVFSHTPRLAISAPAPECGKTVLLKGLIGNLVSRPTPADNITPAPFFRMAASHQPTFLIDEVDAWLKEDSQLPAAINAGWESDGQTVRCQGDGFEVRMFSTHTPVAMAGIQLAKKLKPATIDRCLFIELQRAAPGEIAEYYDRRKHDQFLNELCRRLCRWTSDHYEVLKDHDPVMPAGVLNRLADKWRPLFAVAGVAGGTWTERATRALLAGGSGNTLSKEMQLLLDIQAVLDPKLHEPGIFTDELIRGLCASEDSLWLDYNFRERDPAERRIKPRQLAGLLKDFKCVPETLRRSNERRKGYYSRKLDAAIKRYLPTEGGASVTP